MGSSGSPIINSENNKVIGMNNFGICLYDPNSHNSGIKIDKMYCDSYEAV